uniref:E3 ubiquitin-protein ligase RBBP6 n=1 Tax=Bactrocera dorsalis TaxID=27457 RepID=A0A034WTI5_BACDO
MSVHYKFKSALDFDTVTFDGLNISVGDLKKAIIHQKRLGKVTDFDLQITNAQTKEEYQDDSALIPKNTSLIIARIPISQPKKAWNTQSIEKTPQSRAISRDANSLDLSKMKGSEEEKIFEMMLQSTADYDPKSYHRIRGHSQIGDVPPTYRCNRCKKTGHWIKNCPYTLGKEHSDIKRNTGIPRSFLDKDDKETSADFPETKVSIEKKKEIPDDLICSICKDLFVDAVMIPCCGSSFCDDCVRSALLESEDNECPDCKEKGCSPGSLIPNRFLRNSVNAFKNENGYTNIKTKKEKSINPEEITSTKVKVIAADINKLEEEQTEVATPNETLKTEDGSQAKVVENSSKTETTKAEEVESDYEDNITIMMPPVQVKNLNSGAIELSGRSVSHPKPPGIENSPHHKLQVSPSDSHKRDRDLGLDTESNEWDQDYKLERDYAEEDANGNVFYKNSATKQITQPINAPLHYGPNKIQLRPPRPNHLMDVYSAPSNRANTYQQIPLPHVIAQDTIVQGQPMLPFGLYNPMGPRPNVTYQHPVRPMFHNAPPGFPPIRCPPAEIHHGNSNLASVYQGVAAKVGTGIIEDPLETFNRLMKEKERRREDRRRSMERRRSWSNERHNRGRVHASPYRRISREVKEKLRPHDTERKRDNGFDRNKSNRRRRSNSFSDKSSRSRSWSKSPIKKRSRSPYNKRSRSRTHTFQEKRDTGKSHIIRGEGLRSESAMQRRSTSEERIRSLRQNNLDWYSHQGSTIGSFESDRYASSRKERFNEIPVETLEPPPPGYELNPSSNNCSYQFNQQDYMNSRKRKDRPSSDTKEKKQLDFRGGSDKNDVKPLTRNTEKKVRRTRSPTPVSKKRSGSCDKLEKHNSKRSRNNILVSRKSVERNKPDDYYKRDGSSSEAAKRNNEKNYEKSINSSDEAIVKEMAVNCVKNEKPETFDRNKSPEKQKTKHGSTISKEDEIRSNSSKDEKNLRKPKDKDRKKRRKDKERKKTKKEKKSKRDRERQKTSAESEERAKDVYISRTPELNSCHNIPTVGDIASIEENNANVNSSLSIPDNVDTIKSSDQEHPQDKVKTDSNTNDTEFRRVDSVLDILDYETEFDELNPQGQQKLKNTAPVPEPSKWEIDDNNICVASQIISLGPKDGTDYQNEKLSNEKVTNEVLRKAENAIFARAIKAIYPFDKTEGNNDNQRVYVETLPRIVPKDKIKNFEITVPTSNSQERSVQIKDDSSHSPKVIKSVKERLGSKVTTKYDYSPGRENRNKQHIKSNTIGQSVYERSEERNRSKFKDRGRDNRDNRNSRENRDRGGNKFATLSSRDRDRERNRDRDRFHENDKYRIKERERFRERERGTTLDSRHKSPKQSTRETEVTSRSRPRIRDKGDDEGSHTTAGPRGNENTNSNSKDKIKSKKLSLEDRDTAACSSNVDVIYKKRSLSKERNKSETRNIKKYFTETENRLKSHNLSPCSSSRSTDTSSDSESDEDKRKKKPKYKKDKKHQKRSESMESIMSSKEKHAKNKKRNKSSKKKKKNKK